MLSRAVSRIVPPREVEDIVQETYVRVCQVENKQDILHPKSFMLRTARNLALDYSKRAETRLSVSYEDEFDTESDIPSPNNDQEDVIYHEAASAQEFSHFCQAVRQLPTQCRKVFVLKKVYGYSQREIADDLSISQSTVEKHIANGVRRCSAYMDKVENGKSVNNVTKFKTTGGGHE